MKIKSRDFSNKLEIINDSLINKLYSNDKKYHKNIYCNDEYFNKRLFTHENSSEINFIYKNPNDNYDKPKYIINEVCQRKSNIYNSSNPNLLLPIYNRSKTNNNKGEKNKISSYKNYSNLITKERHKSNNYLPIISSNSNISKNLVDITTPNKNIENDFKKNINSLKKSLNKIIDLKKKNNNNINNNNNNNNNYKNINQNNNDKFNTLNQRNNDLLNIKKNNINNKIFPSNIINNKKPVIIRNNTFEDKLNSDSDISFIEEITDLLKNVDEKKKNIIDKNILNENISNNIEKSNSIKPDLYQFKNLSSESRPFTSYGNVDVRKNNLKKKNEILK